MNVTKKSIAIFLVAISLVFTLSAQAFDNYTNNDLCLIQGYSFSMEDDFVGDMLFIELNNRKINYEKSCVDLRSNGMRLGLESKAAGLSFNRSEEVKRAGSIYFDFSRYINGRLYDLLQPNSERKRSDK